MKKTILTWALSCLTAIAVSAQQHGTDSTYNDTLKAVNLGNLTVRGRTVVTKDDRRTVRPTAEQIRMATGGADLLGRMHLPRVTVNRLTGEIGLTSGGTVVLCINGVPVTAAEIAAVPAEDIIRVEYHDSPGARYAGAEAVIDCITRRKENGGNINAELMNTVGNGHCGINRVSARQSAGRSEWTLNADHMRVSRNEWTRGYDERRILAGSTVTRHEVGQPVPIDVGSLRACLGYSLADKDRYMLSAQLSWTLDDTPRSEEADRRNTLFTSDGNMPADISEHMEERSSSPSLDIYFRRKLGSGQTLTVDAVGTYIGSRSRRTYRETDGGGMVLADVLSDVHGSKHSLIAEAVYELETGRNKLTTGMRHMQAYTANSYKGSATADVAMRQAESSLYAELARHAGRWGWMANVTCLRLRYSQSGSLAATKWAVQPSVRLSFEPDRNSYIKYRADLRTKAPQLAEMNDVEQPVDNGQVRRGNPSLRAFRTLTQTLTAGYAAGPASIDVSVAYDHEHRPVMESVFTEGNIIVRTYENQRSFRKLTVQATLTLRPWRDHLTIAVTSEINRYISHGNSYLHTHTMPKLAVDADFSYGPWTLSYATMRGYANSMYGEQLMEENDMYCVMAGYKRQKWSVQVGALNPFMSEYRMETSGKAAANPSVSRAYTTRPTALMVKLSVNLNHGRQRQQTQRQITNTDTDAGIMKGTKR